MNDQPELDALRAEVRAFLEAEAPRTWRDDSRTQEDFVATQRSWFAKLVKAGYAIPHWPASFPGGGRTLAEQKVIYEELAKADCPRLLLSFVSTYHAFATLHECASPEQQAKYMPRILEGETWCQGSPSRAPGRTSPRSRPRPSWSRALMATSM